MKIILDASPIIFLAKLNAFDLLKDFQCFVPQAVVNELFQKDIPERELLKKFLSQKSVKILITKKDTTFSPSLGRGETSVLALAVEKKIPNVIIDDRRAFYVALTLKLRPKGILWVFLDNFEKKKISTLQAKHYFYELLEQGFYIDEKLIGRLLQKLE